MNCPPRWDLRLSPVESVSYDSRRAIRKPMRMPRLQPLKWILVGGAVWAGSAAAAPQGETSPSVPPSLMSAAECMARIVRSMPGVTGGEITAAPTQSGAYPVLAYAFADA